MTDPKKEIVSALKTALADLGIKGLEQQLEYPKSETHGDYSSNIALIAAKILKKSPFDLAQKIASSVQRLAPSSVEKVEAVKPGFINFWLSKEYLISQLKEILEQKEKFGSKKENLSKKVVVEFSSPNIAKPFTVGHLRSTIIGSAIANLLQANGWKVYKDNHLGDWGTQFGKQMVAIKKWGDEEKISKSENPVRELVALYVKFHEEAEKDPSLEEEGRRWFKKLENGDIEARRLWQKCVDWSLKEFQKTYRVLDIEFTENNGIGYGESFFEDKLKPVVEELEEKDLLKKSEGAELVFFSKDKFPPLMIIKQDGATLYSTRDLATDKFRLEKYGKDIVVVNEVGAEQSLYFRQLFEIEKMLGWYKEGQRIHVKHGLYRFKDQKMSTRKGNTIWLEDVLEEAQKRADLIGSKSHNIKLEETYAETESRDRTPTLKMSEIINNSEIVGIGALKWNDLKRSSILDIVFDWDEILNMEGNSGPYLQYAYARTQSVLSKALTKGHPELVSGSKSSKNEMPKLVRHDTMEDEEASLLRSLVRFPEVVGEAGKNFAPNILCTYLFDLAQKFNLFYQKHKIITVIAGTSLGVNGKHPEGVIGGIEGVIGGVIGTQEFRVELTAAVGQVIKNGLHLLGIQSPERM